MIDNQIHLAREILRLRLSQLLINERYKARDFRVPIHLALGHEALAVALAEIMRDGDQILLPHRNLHYNLARTHSLKAIVAEFLLRKTGLARGKYGSMNLFNAEQGVLYASGILGNNLSVSAGVALAEKVTGSGAVTFVVTGDGAMEEGAFYETLIFLAGQSLASVVVVENNGWSLASRIDERRAPIDVERLAQGCGAGYRKLAGNDVFVYADALEQVRGDATNGKRPVVVEVALKTLGDWRQPTEEFPDGKYINYHAGPAPTTSVAPWPLLAADASDPLHVLCGHFGEAALKAEAETMLAALRKDVA
ncbi:MAG TPA: thiamine pyrophosphate-dependent enzyme [Stellaceae bacterium]|nr:thiamine pyrophosphate-dependent enzyme [Stellaceae bacterium]